MQKHLWFWVVIALVLAVMAATAFLIRREPVSPPATQGGSPGNAEQAIEGATSLPTVDVPSTNPLEKVLPSADSLERTNPFNNVYQNPFE